MVEGDLALDSSPDPARWRRAVGDLDREIEVFEDAVEERERALNLDLDAEQLPDREKEAALQRREGDDVADGQRSLSP